MYSLSDSGYEVLMALLIGVAGFFLRKLDFPVAPVILGVILGPTMEEQFRRSLVISNGDASVFFTRPLIIIIIIWTVLALFVRCRGSSPAFALSRQLATASPSGRTTDGSGERPVMREWAS